MTLLSRARRATLPMAAILMAGCRREDPFLSQTYTDTSDLFSELSLEITTLHELALLRAVVFLTFVIALVTLANFAISRVQRAGRRLGLRQRGRVTAFGLAARLGVLFIAFAAVIHQFSIRVPLLTFFCGLVVVLGVCVGIAVDLRESLSGIILVMESRLKRGDRLMVGDMEGIVVRVGLLRVRVQRTDGRQVYIPLARMSREMIGVSSPSRAVPVELTFRSATPYSQRIREKLRQRAALCPYRDPASQAVVYAPEHDEHHLGVRLYAWSTEAAVMAEGYLRESMERLLEEDRGGS